MFALSSSQDPSTIIYVGGYIISAKWTFAKVNNKLINKGWLNIKTQTYFYKKKSENIYLLKYIKQKINKNNKKLKIK